MISKTGSHWSFPPPLPVGAMSNLSTYNNGEQLLFFKPIITVFVKRIIDDPVPFPRDLYTEMVQGRHNIVECL